MSEIQNLDAECAEVGRSIVKSLEEKHEKNKIKNSINNSLGVLQEDGIYAFTVYLGSEDNSDGEIANEILRRNLKILDNKFDLNTPTDDKLKEKEDVFEELNGFLSEDLDEIFLAKDLMEKTLIYARYHAKALPNDNNEDKGEE